MKVGSGLFPGINRERDMVIALRQSSGQEPRVIWHKDISSASGMIVNGAHDRGPGRHGATP